MKSKLGIIAQIRRMPESEGWRLAVLRRDRFTCQHCGARNGRKQIIEVDHIVGLAELVKANNITTIDQARECGQLWDTANGRTLCHNCHEKTDSYPVNLRGNKGKRRKQWFN